MSFELKNSLGQSAPATHREIFKQENNLEEIYQFSREVAEYLQQENIHNLVLIDRSARNFYVGVKEYWQAKFPEDKEPNYYFLNPEGFKYQTDSDLTKEFEQVYKNLSQAKEQPLLVFDTCIHSGNSLYPIKEFLKKNGFSDVRLAAVKTHRQDSKALVQPDLIIGQDSLKEGATRGCRPFGDGSLVEKNSEHIYCTPAQDVRKRQLAQQSKKEIKQAIREYLAKELE